MSEQWTIPTDPVGPSEAVISRAGGETAPEEFRDATHRVAWTAEELRKIQAELDAGQPVHDAAIRAAGSKPP